MDSYLFIYTVIIRFVSILFVRFIRFMWLNITTYWHENLSRVNIYWQGKQTVLSNYEAKMAHHLFGTWIEETASEVVDIININKTVTSCVQLFSLNFHSILSLTEHLQRHGSWLGNYVAAAVFIYPQNVLLFLKDSVFFIHTFN